MSYKCILIAIASFTIAATVALASSGVFDPVSTANVRLGHPDNKLAGGLSLFELARGADPIENPSGLITNFGLLNDFPPQTIEASKTEPDENTYLVFEDGLGGPTDGFDYGTHFLFQGHENGKDLAYVTRINLDVTDPAHRITLMTPTGADGKTGLNSIDGSTWDPFSGSLLFTQETSFPLGGIVEVTPDWPATIRRLDGILGSSAYEGIHADKSGNLIFLEDAGGARVHSVQGDPTSPLAPRQPNSFVYLFVPNDKEDLGQGGVLFALQVLIDGQPVTFHAADPEGDVFSDAQLKLHSPGTAWPFKWVQLHDTSENGFAVFNANALAKAAGATPFKRPENGAFLPGSDFRTFFFDATGDTDVNAGSQPELAARGAWGSIFRLEMPGLEGGTISIFFLGDRDHAGFDNMTFLDERTLLAAEDRGDSLHSQLNALDSIWAFDIHRPGQAPRRAVALGRDEESEFDAGLLDAQTDGFQNDGDNEPTGLHVSDGGSTIQQLLGRATRQQAARWFFTQQHGENRVFEVVRSR
jgi:hypothetical protein